LGGISEWERPHGDRSFLAVHGPTKRRGLVSRDALYPTGLFFDETGWRRWPDIQTREGDYSRPPRCGPDPEVMSERDFVAFLPMLCSDKVTARETAEGIPFLQSTRQED
jgi:hypothetical protein